jgi:hypothetical protein
MKKLAGTLSVWVVVALLATQVQGELIPTPSFSTRRTGNWWTSCCWAWP